MAFAWRRARRLQKLNRHRDVREDLLRLGRYAPAPVSNTAPPTRFCPHDWNTLWGAAALGYAKIVRRFLEQGAPVNARDEWGRTALWWAVDERRYEIAERLLAWSANPNCPDEQGMGPLHIAVIRGDTELVELLLHHEAHPDGENQGDRPTPLMWAVRFGDTELVQCLLRAGASIHAQDRWGHTALFYVRGVSATHTLPALLQAGAQLSERAGDGDTPLHRALRTGDARLWKALTPGDDEADFLTYRGRADDTLLHAAAEGGNPALLQRLLSRGANPNTHNAFGHTPLLVALTSEHLTAATLLTQSGAVVTFLDAIAMGDAERAASLAPAPAGTLLDAPVGGQETPLMGAIARGRDDLVELLLSCGASPNAGTRLLGTPLDIAVFSDQPELARLLLARGADIRLLRHVSQDELRALLGESGEQETLPTRERLEGQRLDTDAVYTAAVAGDDALRFLLLCGGDLDIQDEHHDTALLRAARDGDAPAVQRLLTFGASAVGARAVAQGRPIVLAVLEAAE